MKRICPLCGREYNEAPALSRRDNKTDICSECGLREALEDAHLCNITRTDLEKLREMYPAGTKVRLEKMDDPQAPPVGTSGVVQMVDDIGTIHVSWSNGSSLGAIYAQDKVSIIK